MIEPLGHWWDWGNYIYAEKRPCQRGVACDALSTAYADVGDIGPGGGRIFYRAPDGAPFKRFRSADDTTGVDAYYLELAPQVNFPAVRWVSTNFIPATAPSVEGTGVIIGYGMKNTLLIRGQDPNAPAALECTRYVTIVDGKEYKDWFLPSSGELQALYTAYTTARAAAVLVDPLKPDNHAFGDLIQFYYWSSTQGVGTSAQATYMDFFTTGGGMGGAVSYDSKDKLYRVRPIRAF
jgi:hypothetical protein